MGDTVQKPSLCVFGVQKGKHKYVEESILDIIMAKYFLRLQKCTGA